jgi:cytochrome c oxidase cbb3-type subunit 3
MNCSRFAQVFVVLVLCNAAFAGPPAPQEQNQPPQTPKDQAKPAAPAKGIDFQEVIRDFMAIGAPPDPEAVKRGQATYIPNCGFCHGSNARGGSSGPNLVRSVVVLHDQGTGKEIYPVVHTGRPDKGMPPFPQFQESQVKDIAAFLLSLVQANANRQEYQILNIVTGDAAKGETYFKAHCASCHSPSGDLAHIAAKFDPVALQSRFLYPKTDRFAGPPNPAEKSTATIKVASGQTYSGTVDRLDDFSVSITDSSGQHQTYSLEETGTSVQVRNPLQGHLELLRQYSDDDMHNILAFLETLK